MKKSLIMMAFNGPISDDQAKRVISHVKPIADALDAEFMIVPDGATTCVIQQAQAEMLEAALDQNRILMRIAEALESVAYGGSFIRTMSA